MFVCLFYLEGPTVGLKLGLIVGVLLTDGMFLIEIKIQSWHYISKEDTKILEIL